MPITVAVVESELVGRAGGKLAKVGFAVTTDGANADLLGPIRKALVASGLSPDDAATVADADLAGLSGPRLERFYDLAELATLRKVLGAFAEVDQQVGQNMQKLSQFGDQVRASIALLEGEIAKPLTASRATAGTIAAGSPMPNDPMRPCSFVNPCGWPYP